MSLATSLLNSLDTTIVQETSAYSDEEPHIVINESRQAIVPNELKTIAVTGDKDIETITFDCVRYWDGQDLSTFAIYLNYVLPDGTSGTYIPESIVAEDDVFHFDWKIKNNITQKNGKISFAITAVKTKQNESGETVLDKQWGSIPNSDCSIALGLDISNVPDDEESADILAQMSAILEEMQGNILADLIVQSGGTDTAKVMSQAASSNTFSNAIKGNVSGKIVSMDDVSPVEHNVPVKLRSETLQQNTQVTVKSCGKNLIPYPYESTTVTKGGLTFTDNGDGSVTINGTSTENVSFVLCRGIAFFSSYTGVSGSNKVAKEGLCMSNRGTNTTNVGLALEFWGSGGIPTLIIFCNSGNTYTNAVVRPQIEVGETPTEYELYKEGETVTTDIANGAELASIAPNMSITTDNDGVIVEAQYNKDATRVIEKLTNAIIALGGTV